MGRLFTKPGVDYGDGLAPAGQVIYDTVKKLTEAYDFNMTVTSARDGAHSGPTDPHKRGEALDFRSKHLTADEKARVLADIQRVLYAEPRRFYAFLEAPGTPNEHYHVQLRQGLRNYPASKLADFA